MFPIIAVIVLVLLAAVFIAAATRPADFRIERTTSVKAPPEKVFALVNDFHSWASWSPFEKYDPAMRKSFSGSPSGRGAVYEWEGNSKAGKGRMEITTSDTPSRVTIQLDFLKPFVAHNTAEFILESAGGSTGVTWAMLGQRPYAMKLMSLFVNMDRMVGRDFESGLASLKTLTEK